jgi:hypothetical protein
VVIEEGESPEVPGTVGQGDPARATNKELNLVEALEMILRKALGDDETLEDRARTWPCARPS